MFLYSALLFSARFLRLRDDQAGDNLYYLGFLFTLTSLGFSLWQFTSTGATETIIENFGIALSTTIAGVVLRVIFNQMRQDPMEVERTARLELADAARKIRNELDAAAMEFSHFRRSQQQSLTDAAAEINKHIDGLVSKAAKGWDDVPARSIEPLEKVSAQAAATLEKLNTTLISGLDDGSKRLFSAIDSLTKQAEAVSDQLGLVSGKLSSISIPREIPLGKIDVLSQTLARAVDELRDKATQQHTALHAAVLAIQDASDTAVGLAEAVRESGTFRSGEIDFAAGRIRQIIESLARFLPLARLQQSEGDKQILEALTHHERRLEKVVSLLERQAGSASQSR